jgi:hypothetical protein
MPESTQDKIQKIELETVKSITEMKVDIRNLTEVIKDLKDTLNRMSDNYATKEELAAFKEAVNTRLNKLESWNAWAVKIVLGAVITAVLSLVIYTKAL